jgi:hypothetical protein
MVSLSRVRRGQGRQDEERSVDRASDAPLATDENLRSCAPEQSSRGPFNCVRHPSAIISQDGRDGAGSSRQPAGSSVRASRSSDQVLDDQHRRLLGFVAACDRKRDQPRTVSHAPSSREPAAALGGPTAGEASRRLRLLAADAARILRPRHRKTRSLRTSFSQLATVRVCDCAKVARQSSKHCGSSVQGCPTEDGHGE